MVKAFLAFYNIFCCSTEYTNINEKLNVTNIYIFIINIIYNIYIWTFLYLYNYIEILYTNTYKLY